MPYSFVTATSPYGVAVYLADSLRESTACMVQEPMTLWPELQGGFRVLDPLSVMSLYDPGVSQTVVGFRILGIQANGLIKIELRQFRCITKQVQPASISISV